MIVFILVPGLYAAVEQSDDPSLRGRPVIVGGDPAKRGRVTSASREARARGVEDGMETGRALELCPDAVLRRTRVKRYRELAAELRELLRAESERLEDVGLDGTLLELPPGVDAIARAAELCVRIGAELGVAAVAGIGPTRFVAVQAAQHAGPGGIRRVREDEALAFLGALPVEALWGLGPATTEKLAERRVRTIAQLRALDPAVLAEIAGARAAAFLDYAWARDRAALAPRPRTRTLSQEQTLDEPSVDLRALGERLDRLAERLAASLARERRDARTVSLTLHFLDGTQSSRTQTLDAPTADAARLGEAAQQLLARTQAGARPVRRLRLALGGLARATSREGPRQLRLF